MADFFFTLIRLNVEH